MTAEAESCECRLQTCLVLACHESERTFVATVLHQLFNIILGQAKADGLHRLDLGSSGLAFGCCNRFSCLSGPIPAPCSYIQTIAEREILPLSCLALQGRMEWQSQNYHKLLLHFTYMSCQASDLPQRINLVWICFRA